MTINEKLRVIIDALEDKKGENIVAIDISKISVIADYFVIVNGNNLNQVEALADNVKDELFKNDILPRNIEGFKNAGWVLMDYEDIVVHVFDKDDRFFYDLERVWSDGKIVDLSCI